MKGNLDEALKIGFEAYNELYELREENYGAYAGILDNIILLYLKKEDLPNVLKFIKIRVQNLDIIKE